MAMGCTRTRRCGWTRRENSTALPFKAETSATALEPCSNCQRAATRPSSSTSTSTMASGAFPTQPLLRTADGTIYGTAEGNGGSGVEIQTQPEGRGNQPLQLCRRAEWQSQSPSSGVMIDAAGNLYGATVSGGHSACNKNRPPYCGTIYNSNRKVSSPSYTVSTGDRMGLCPRGT